MTLQSLLKKHLSPVNPSGSELICTCPSCGKTQHFYFNIQKGLGLCHRCGYSCNEFQLLRKFGEEASLNHQIRASEFSSKETPASPLKLPRFTHPLPHDSKLGKKAEKFLASRNITVQQAQKFKFGVCEGWRRGEQNFSGRLILPVYESGRLVFFQARSLSSQEPKYLNLKGYKKSHFLFNPPEGREAILTEGVFSAIAVNGTAMFGKALSSYQLKKLERLELKKVTVLLDSDARGEALSLARKLKSYGDWKVEIALLPEGDPADCSESQLKELLGEAVDIVGSDIDVVPLFF